MAEHKHSFMCPVCGGVISTDSEESTVKKAQEHAKKEHQKDLSVDMVKKMMQEQAKAKK
ncbi:MAG: DUF1059 domain-containing protein [Anaerolineae bacterium]